MGRKQSLYDRERWLTALDPFSYEGGPVTAKGEFEKLNLADTLLALAEISHQTEYTLCGSVAQHVLGHRLDPDAEDVSLP
jgi:hypothetical protein